MKKMITELEYIRKAYKFALEKIEKLEKENIRISNQRDNLSWISDNLLKENDFLREENDRLKKEIEELKTDYDRLKRAFNDVLYDKK